MTQDIEAKTDREILIQVDTKVDGINSRLDKMNGTDKDQEERIRSLEGFREWVKGGGAVVVTFLIATGSAVGFIFGG